MPGQFSPLEIYQGHTYSKASRYVAYHDNARAGLCIPTSGAEIARGKACRMESGLSTTPTRPDHAPTNDHGPLGFALWQ